MFRIAFLALIAALAGANAQENPFIKPPADVDTALRARIWEFFDDHVKGQFRKAEELVAEDTKDFFYTHNKPQYLGFEISRIEYSDHFTKAKATVVCEQFVAMPGFTDKPMKVPTPSTWKIENGKWVWYVDQDALRNSPWGKMTPGPGVTPGKQAAPPSPALIQSVTPEQVLSQVKADKDSLEVVSGTSGQVSIANTAPGNMEIKVMSAPEGIDARLDKTSLGPGEKAVLTLKPGRDPKPGVVTLQAEPTGQLISIKVTTK